MRKLLEREDGADQLRRAGLRVTAPRLAVLSVLQNSPHADVDTVATMVRKRLGTISGQAIYDVLHALTQAGLARRIEPGGSRALYEARVGDNHHHVVCRSCGTVADVDCTGSVRPCLNPDQSHGFILDEAEITFWGICPGCQHTTNERSDT